MKTPPPRRLTTRLPVLVGLVLASTAPAAARPGESYALGPGDRVQVRVSDFRSGGESYQWSAFEPGAEFVVGPDGRLSLPILGGVEAAGKTAADLEEEIGARLQAKAGLIVRPDASVQIVRFRPFYVIGVVDKPGEYEYRPGLTVLEAYAMAGGAERATSDQMLVLERDALTSRGDLRVLSAARVALLARRARLEAEMAEAPKLAFPAELQAKASAPDAARLMEEERLLFESRRNGLAREIAALDQNRAYLVGEIETLRNKGATLDREIGAMRKELDIVAGLLSRGLTAAPRQLELEQSLAQIQGNQLDVQVAITRANEDISKSDRESAQLKAKFRRDVLEEAAQVRDKLAETDERIETARALIEEAETRAPNLQFPTRAGYAKPTYVLTRRESGGGAREVAAQEGDAVQPGDVVRVIPATGDRAEPGPVGLAD